MNRTEFQTLAEERILDAHALEAAGRHAGAYYIAGYAVECALKACISGLTQAGDFPPPVSTVRDLYTHNLRTLLAESKLSAALDAESSANPVFANYWALVVDWNEQKRYELGTTNLAAANLIQAIDDPTNGVLRWLRMHW